MVAGPGTREELGPTPGVEDEKAVYSWAVGTSNMEGAPQVCWNEGVHSGLLGLALHGGRQYGRGKVGVWNW